MAIKPPEGVNPFSEGSKKESAYNDHKIKQGLINTYFGGRKWYRYKRDDCATFFDLKKQYQRTNDKNIDHGYVQVKWPISMRKREEWAKKHFRSLVSLKKKIAQLFLLSITASWDDPEDSLVRMFMQHHGIGGLVFHAGDVLHQLYRINQYQKLSQIPLISGHETLNNWQMGLDHFISMPGKETLCRVKDPVLLYQAGLEMGKRCLKSGLTTVFLSIQDHHEKRVLTQYLRGCASSGLGILYSLNSDTPNCYEMDNVIRNPMKTLGLNNHGVTMPWGKLSCRLLPAFKIHKWTVADLRLLKEKPLDLIGRMTMRCLKNDFDSILVEGDITELIEFITHEVLHNRFSIDRLNKKVMKILYIKQLFGLSHKISIPCSVTYDSLNTKKARLLKRRIYEETAFVIKEEKYSLPLKISFIPCPAYIHIGRHSHLAYDEISRSFTTQVKVLELSTTFLKDKGIIKSFIKELGSFPVVLAIRSHNDELFNKIVDFIKQFTLLGTEVVVIFFERPYADKIIERVKTCIFMPEDKPEAELAAIDILLGRVKKFEY